MGRQRFASCYLEFSLGGKPQGVVALVSEDGAIKIQFHELPYSRITALAGRPVHVLMAGKLRVEGRLMKELTLSGSFYRLKFSELPAEAKALIQDSIAMQSHPASWERSSDRFSAQIENPNYERALVATASVEKPFVEYQLDVLDFSKQGLQLQATGNIFSSFSIGKELNISLTTNANQRITGLQTKIVRIEEDFDEVTNQPLFRFGLEIFAMHELSQRKYDKLLAAAAQAYTAEMPEKIAA